MAERDGDSGLDAGKGSDFSILGVVPGLHVFRFFKRWRLKMPLVRGWWTPGGRPWCGRNIGGSQTRVPEVSSDLLGVGSSGGNRFLGFLPLHGADDAGVGEGSEQIEHGGHQKHLPVGEVVGAQDFEDAGGDPPGAAPDRAAAGTHEFAVALADVGRLSAPTAAIEKNVK